MRLLGDSKSLTPCGFAGIANRPPVLFVRDLDGIADNSAANCFFPGLYVKDNLPYAVCAAGGFCQSLLSAYSGESFRAMSGSMMVRVCTTLSGV